MVGPLSTCCFAGKKHALVIGVSSYQAGQPLPALPYADNDAIELSKVLKTGGYDLTLMTQSVISNKEKENLAPTMNYIREQISAILDSPFLKDEDIVLVALAGQGVQFEHTDENGNKSSKYYFCPADADVLKIRTANDVTERNALLDLDELYQAMSNCKAGAKLLFVDTCRNDPTKPSSPRSIASSTLPLLPSPPGGTAAFFGCSANQQAYEVAELKHSVFFHQVIEALRGDADSSTPKHAADGEITLAEISEYVSASTYDMVRKKFQGAKQTPELKGEFRVSIPLISVQKIPNEVLPSAVPPSEPPQEFTNSLGMKLILIKSGSFMMGSPANESRRDSDEVQHEVTLTKDFYLGETEVTRKQFIEFVNATGYKTEAETNKRGGWGFDQSRGHFVRGVMYTWKKTGMSGIDENHPVVNISWNDAQKFVTWLSEKEGKRYRLPTEAQWEYACRGGTSAAYQHGDDSEDLILVGNVADATLKRSVDGYEYTETSDGFAFTSPGKSFRGNAFGLHDMHGNVWEWCSDWYGKYPTGSVSDPIGATEGTHRVLRGGSWYSSPEHCRSANRDSNFPASRVYLIGFRVAVDR